MSDLIDTILRNKPSTPALGSFSVIERLLTASPKVASAKEEPAATVQLKKQPAEPSKPEVTVYHAKTGRKPAPVAPVIVEKQPEEPVREPAVKPLPAAQKPVAVEPTVEVPDVPAEPVVTLRGRYGNGEAALDSGAQGKYWANMEQGRIEFQIGGYQGYFVSPTEAVAINQKTGEAYSFTVELGASNFNLNAFKPLPEGEAKRLGLTDWVTA